MAITGNVGVLHRYIHTLMATSVDEAEGSAQTVAVEVKNESAVGSSRESEGSICLSSSPTATRTGLYDRHQTYHHFEELHAS